MKIKKIVLLGLSVALAAALLSGCGAKEEPGERLQSVYGKVTDATMATLTLRTEEDSACTVAMDDDTVVYSGEGILLDDHVLVVYTGDLAGGKAVAKQVAVTSEEEVQKVCGTIEDAANASLAVLDSATGETVQIVKTDDTVTTADLTIGGYVEVTYQELSPDGYPVALEIR